MKKKKLDVAVWIAAFAVVAVSMFAVGRYAQILFAEKSSDALGEVAAVELIAAAHEGDGPALREWLRKQGPDNAHRVVLRLDNSNDRDAQVRLEVLRAIDSMSAEGLSTEVVQSWALVLRSLANGVLHDGPDRSDFIARSYVMEGRFADAAVEYRRFPTSLAATVYFGAHPDQRAPASAPTSDTSGDSTSK